MLRNYPTIKKEILMSNENNLSEGSVNNLSKGLLLGVLAGGAVGAIVTLLTTPKSGKEFRSDIKQKSNEYLDATDKYLTNTKTKAHKMFNEGKRKSSLIIKDLKSGPDGILKETQQVIEDAKLRASDIIHSGKEKIEFETDRVKTSVKAGMDAYKEAKSSSLKN
jgi:gas vesicle protein